MKKSVRGFAYLVLLGLATTGFMFGGGTLFFLILWATSWSPPLFWVITPLLLFMGLLECIILAMMMEVLRHELLTKDLTLSLAWRVFWKTAWASFRIWQLAFMLIAGYPEEVSKAKRRHSLTKAPVRHRFSMRPIQERVNREFVGMCH